MCLKLSIGRIDIYEGRKFLIKEGEENEKHDDVKFLRHEKGILFLRLALGSTILWQNSKHQNKLPAYMKAQLYYTNRSNEKKARIIYRNFYFTHS